MDKKKEASYWKILRMMNSHMTLRPYVKDRKTHLVTDASPQGIAASLYQEDESGTWFPVDHISQALSEMKKNWDSQIYWEPLVKVFRMKTFRHYLISTEFMAWGDHQPLIRLYNNTNRLTPARVSKHRGQVMDLVFKDKYISGKKNLADFNS